MCDNCTQKEREKMDRKMPGAARDRRREKEKNMTIQHMLGKELWQ